MKIDEMLSKAENRISFNIDPNRALDYANDAAYDLASRFKTACIVGRAMAIIKDDSDVTDPHKDRICLFGPSNALIKLPPKTVKLESVFKEEGSEYRSVNIYTAAEAEEKGLFKAPGINYYLEAVTPGVKEKYLQYEVEANYIRFSEEGNYHLEYYRLPDDAKNVSAEPEIHESYHNAIMYFIAAQEMHRLFGEENSDVMLLLSKYEKMAEDANALLSENTRRKRRTLPSGRW